MKKKIVISLVLLVAITVCIINIGKVEAEESNEKYSIDYLLKHYNAVTLGTKNNNILTEYQQKIQGTNKGDIKNLNVEGPVLARGEYANKVNEDVDFDKMYAQVMNESQMLVDMTEYHINDYYINVDKPGIYMINNTAKANDYYRLYNSDQTAYSYDLIYYNTINIKEYDPQKYYVFNLMDSMVTNNIKITLTETGAPSSIDFIDFLSSGKYTGNIIFNYPNARYIGNNMINGNIIAPKADIYCNTEYSYNVYWNNGIYEQKQVNTLTGTVIANSITHIGELSLKNSLSSVNNKLLNEFGEQYINEVEDFTDDKYYGDYSLPTLLQNYNIVSLGQKDYQPNTKFSSINYPKGSTSIFHIASQFLINGHLGIEGENYPGYANGWGEITPNYIRLDLDSNLITDSYLNGNVMSGEYNARNDFYDRRFYIKYWDMNSDRRGSKNHMFLRNDTYYEDGFYKTGAIYTPDNFLNFERLYNNIVKEQSAIKEGTKVSSKDGVAHVKVGGIYTIEDITDVDEIVFDNFDDNKDKLTIINIKNSGNINFPLISKDTGSYKGIPTNDYYGKTVANQEYEMNGLLPDEYHGNIIFNVPNANYIKLAPNAPFAGHLIAPNADVETEETQLAGCMIVNSLHAEGGSEAHFYPLTSTATYEVSEYNDLTKSEKATLGAMRLKRLLGGSASTIETTVLGDETEFRKEEAKLNEILDKEQNKTSNNTIAPIIDILQNPLTKRSVLIIGSILTIISVTIYFTFKKKA